jgi:hypothetical protein
MAINEPGDAIAGSSTVFGCFPVEVSTAAVGIMSANRRHL